MKILFHLNSMGRGGAERVVSILSNHFAEMGNEVIVATEWFSEKEYPLLSSVKRISVGLTEKEDQKGRVQKIILRHTKLRACIRKEAPDLVISFCNKANFRCAISMLGMRIPLLVSVRNDPQKDYAPYRFSTWLMQKKAKGCVFQTPDAKSFFSETFQKKSTIIFNPLSEGICNYSLPEVVERKKEIVTVGRISEQKNQLLLVKAFHTIASDFPDYSLKIYGEVQDKDVYETLQAYIEDNDLQERVLFMGASEKIQEKISTASLFVLPSDFEGMPNALIEAMALGIPCISTDCPCGGSALLIEQNKSGILVPVSDEMEMADAMKKLLTDSMFAEKLGLHAREVREKVLPDRICEQWIQYIDEILGE